MVAEEAGESWSHAFKTFAWKVLAAASMAWQAAIEPLEKVADVAEDVPCNFQDVTTSRAMSLSVLWRGRSCRRAGNRSENATEDWVVVEDVYF